MTLHDDFRPAGSDPNEQEADRPWLPMSIAPRDRRVDLRAERWVVGHQRMRTEVFPRCLWSPGGTARQVSPRWKRLPVGWIPTHWREAEPNSYA